MSAPLYRQTNVVPFLAERDESASLPAPLTSFIGREREVAALGALLREPDVRLVTLTGVGGVGKTRLALRVAAELAAEGHFADGVVFVDLAAVRDPELVAPVIAQTLGVRGIGQEPAVAALKTFLRNRQHLLILDNFEQVSEVGRTLTALLQASPGLAVLVTSRSLLNVSGEQAMPVPPLSLGGAAETAPGRADQPLVTSDAVRLFVERTRAVNPGFALSTGNEPVIAEIVQRLDGLPLAIELAAARGALLSPAALLARLERPLPHLTDGPRDQPARHRTMRAAIAWSYELLTPEEQRVFRALGVFAGGGTLEAVEYVGGEGGRGEEHPVLLPKTPNPHPPHLVGPRPTRAPPDQGATGGGQREVAPGAGPRGEEHPVLFPSPPTPLPPSVLDLVASLARQSLVQAVVPADDGSADGATRIVMLETIREFAAEQLAAAGEDALARDRHAAWFLEIVEALDLHHTMQGDAVRISRLVPEQDNLRQALAWIATWDDARPFNRLSAALAVFWFDLGQFAEARTWLHRAIARDDGVPVLTRARAWSEAGWLAMCQGDLDLAQSFRDRALAFAQEAGEPYLLADAIFKNGILAFWQGDLQRAAVLMEEAHHALLAIGKEVAAAPVKAAAAVNLLGGVALIAGDVPLAIRRGEEAVGMARALGAGADLGYALCGLGYARLQEGSVPEAAACFLEATALTWKIRDDAFLARVLWAMAAVAITREHLDAAAGLIGAADALDERTGSAMWPNDRAVAEWCLGQFEGAGTSAELSDLRRAGASHAVEQAVAASQLVASMVLGDKRAAGIWQATGAPDPGLTTVEIVPDVALAPAGLTRRELDVLHQLLNGQTDREIAARLFITRRTASKHVEAILAKLGVRSRGAAVAEARRLGLAPPPPAGHND